MRDLNSRPSRCKRAALPTELIAHMNVGNIVPFFKIISMAPLRAIFVYTFSMHEIYCIVSGKVQNVRYRDYVQVSATTLGVTGWVQNLPDGTVAVCAQGVTDQLKDFVEYLHEGSLQAKVEGISVDWRTTKRASDDFSIRY
jgi:acylphosphatase